MKPISLILSLLMVSASCAGSGDDNGNRTVGVDGKLQVDTETDKVTEVSVMELTPSVFNHEIVSNGKVTAHEKVDVNFQSQGIISEIYVRNGQRVSRGQRIASIDTYVLENQIEKDRNSIATAQLDLQDVLIGQGYDPEQMEKIPADIMKLARLRSGLDQAELALADSQRKLQDATLTAPIDGVIANLSVSPHSITTSDPLCRIINDSGMDIEFPVLESELPVVKPGDEVSVSPFSSASSHTGHITEINPMVDENGMVRVWASVNGGNGLIDGMNVRLSIRRRIGEALVVPKTAVVLRSGRQVVFTLDGGKAIWNYVTTGMENYDSYVIEEGLRPGQIVIVEGNENLAHEAPVEVIR